MEESQKRPRQEDAGCVSVASERVGDGVAVRGEESVGASQPGGHVATAEDDIEFRSVSNGSEDEADFVKGMAVSLSEAIYWMRSCWRTDVLAARARRFLRQSAKNLCQTRRDRRDDNKQLHHMSRDVIRGVEQTRRDACHIKAAAVVRALHAEGMTTSGEMLRSIAALSEVRGERAKATRDLGACLRDPTTSVKSLRRISEGMGMRPQRNLTGRNHFYAEVKATWLQQVRTLHSFSVAAGACQPGV